MKPNCSNLYLLNFHSILEMVVIMLYFYCGCSTAKLCQRTVLGNRSLVWLSAMFFGFLHRVVLVREIVLHRLA